MTQKQNKPFTKPLVTIVIIALIVIIILMLGPWYTLSEIEIAIITRLGKPLKPITEAGLHLKIPIIDKPNKLPKRILEWDGDIKQFPTYDKRMILVDATVRWKISEPIDFFESFTNELGAVGRLDDILDAASREVVSRHTFEELVRNSNRIKELDEQTITLLVKQGFTVEELSNFPAISIGRDQLSNEMQKYAAEKLKNYGIELVDFYVKKVLYIEENLRSVFESMIAERSKIAETYRSEGEKQRQGILGETSKRTKEILGEAHEKSKEIMGEADAEAARIYNNAYAKNASTQDFYEFMKKMQMYQEMPPNASLIISTNSDYFDMLKNYK